MLAKLLRGLIPAAQLHKHLLVAQPVPAERVTPSRRNSPIAIVQVEQEAYDFAWFPRPPEFITARFRQGARCFVAFKGSEALGCLWLQLGPYLEDVARCRYIPYPPQQTAWDFDVYIKPEYRLGRTFIYLWDYAWDWLRQRGIRWSMSRIDAFNSDSIRAHQRLGATVVGTVTFVQIGAWQLLIASTKPYLHLSLRNIPAIVVKAPAAAKPSAMLSTCCLK